MNKEIINQMKKRIVILGGGESGAGAAVLAKGERTRCVRFRIFRLSNPNIRICWMLTKSVGKRAGIPKPIS